MSLTRIVCPHCEQSMEVQLTSVTRSRDCPHCGKNIILRTAARDGKQQLKALLMPVTRVAGDEDQADSAGATSPRPLTGDPLRRMAHDPEVRRTSTLFKWGSIIFGSLLLLALVADKFKFWSSLSDVATQVSQSFRPAPEIDSEEPGPAGGVSSSTRSGAKPEIKPDAASAEAEAEKQTLPEVPAGPQLTEQQHALQGAIAFLKAPSVEDRLTRVRDRRMNEERIRAYYAREPDGPIPYDRIEPLEVNAVGSFTYSFNVVLKDGTRRKIIMGKARQGEYMADWSSFVLYSEMPWDEFRSKRPATPTVFRVLADKEQLFGRDFTDSEAYLCVRLTNPVDQSFKPLYGYALKSSSVGQALSFVLDKGQLPAPLILKLRFPEDATTDYQVWIAEFIGEGWMARNW